LHEAFDYATVRRRQAFRLSLTEVLALIARFKAADDRQDLLNSDVSRKPTDEQHSQTRRYRGVAAP